MATKALNVDKDGFKGGCLYPGQQQFQVLWKMLTYSEDVRRKAYASAEHDQLLAKRNTGNRIMHKPSATDR